MKLSMTFKWRQRVFWKLSLYTWYDNKQPMYMNEPEEITAAQPLHYDETTKNLKKPQLWHRRNQGSWVPRLQRQRPQWEYSMVGLSIPLCNGVKPDSPCEHTYARFKHLKTEKEGTVDNFPPHVEICFEKLPLKLPLTSRKAWKTDKMPKSFCWQINCLWSSRSWIKTEVGEKKNIWFWTLWCFDLGFTQV